jgi:hypothetical protein
MAEERKDAGAMAYGSGMAAQENAEKIERATYASLDEKLGALTYTENEKTVLQGVLKAYLPHMPKLRAAIKYGPL